MSAMFRIGRVSKGSARLTAGRSVARVDRSGSSAHNCPLSRRIDIGLEMDAEIPRGKRQIIGGHMRVYYDGYWVKTYEPPVDSLSVKLKLIEALTRRLFNHVEHGLNVPGSRLGEARAAYVGETDSRRKRVKAGMLAGALFNRAAEVFKKLVELQALGVDVHTDNPLMRQCGEHLQEALALGKSVLHYSGEEGIDELWGEPFKAFAYSVEDFYKTRYVKIAMCMAAIDRIALAMIENLAVVPSLAGIDQPVRALATAACAKSETLRTDPDIFEIWTSFVVAGEELCDFTPNRVDKLAHEEARRVTEGLSLLRTGAKLIEYIARARVPMPKSTREFIERCEHFRTDVAELVPQRQSVA